MKIIDERTTAIETTKMVIGKWYTDGKEFYLCCGSDGRAYKIGHKYSSIAYMEEIGKIYGRVYPVRVSMEKVVGGKARLEELEQGDTFIYKRNLYVKEDHICWKKPKEIITKWENGERVATVKEWVQTTTYTVVNLTKHEQLEMEKDTVVTVCDVTVTVRG